MEPKIYKNGHWRRKTDRAGFFLSYIGVNPEQLCWDSHQSNWEQNLANIIHLTSGEGSDGE